MAIRSFSVLSCFEWAPLRRRVAASEANTVDAHRRFDRRKLVAIAVVEDSRMAAAAAVVAVEGSRMAAAAAAEGSRTAVAVVVVAVDCSNIVADSSYSPVDTAVEQVDSNLVWDCCTLDTMRIVGTVMVVEKQSKAVAEDSIAWSNFDETRRTNEWMIKLTKSHIFYTWTETIAWGDWSIESSLDIIHSIHHSNGRNDEKQNRKSQGLSSYLIEARLWRGQLLLWCPYIECEKSSSGLEWISSIAKSESTSCNRSIRVTNILCVCECVLLWRRKRGGGQAEKTLLSSF